MGQGAYITLMAMLQAAPSLQGVSVVFGEEYKNAQEFPLPMVAVVPGSCVFKTDSFPGYGQVTAPDLDNLWMLTETISLVCWASVDANANPPPTAVQNADAVEDLRVNVLRALQTQALGGLYFVPQSGQWQLFNDQSSRYGRAFVRQVAVDITHTTAPYVDATVPCVEITPEIEA